MRHEWSAPYDSNTNAFIERARRTVFEGVCTSLIRSGAPTRFWGEAEKHKIYTINILPTLEDPQNEGKFCSRRDLLEGCRRPPNLEKLVAFGTKVTCYIPQGQRKGNKNPSQRRAFTGVIMGYEDNMPAYRVWDLQQQMLFAEFHIIFVFATRDITHFKDKNKLASPEYLDDPENFAHPV